MTWTNPTVPISSLRDMLVQSATWQSLTTTPFTSHIHYPGSNISGDVSGTTADPLPLIVLFHEDNRRNKYAVGAAGLAQGTLVAVLYQDTDVGTININAQGILADLLALDTGLALRDGKCSECSDPTPGQRATTDTGVEIGQYRTVTITLEYGLTV